MKLIILAFLLVTLVFAKEETYSVTRDLRKCAFPMCGGYFISGVNTAESRKYVANLKLSLNISSLLDKFPLDLVLTGEFKETKDFNELVVSSVYKGVDTPDSYDDFRPDVPLDGYAYYSIKKVSNNSFTLNEVNTGRVYKDVKSYETVNYTGLLFDQNWFTGRIEDNAIVVGHLTNSDSPTLRIIRVYIQLPDPKEKCSEPVGKCDSDKIKVYTRDSNRCIAFDGCVSRGPCPLLVPRCPTNYILVRFPSKPKGCPKYFCDPDFVEYSKLN